MACFHFVIYFRQSFIDPDFFMYVKGNVMEIKGYHLDVVFSFYLDPIIIIRLHVLLHVNVKGFIIDVPLVQ